MKTLILAVNSKYIHSSLAPWYLAAAAKTLCQKNHSVFVLETTINQKEGDILENILSFCPDVVAFSCYIWNIRVIKRLLRQLPEQIKVVLGGPEVSFRAACFMKEHPRVDFLIKGEGEAAFAQLLDSICGDFFSIPGLCFKNNGEIVENQAAPCHTDPPNPYTKEYFASLLGRIAYIEASRGCPFSCSFCLSGREDKVRFFDLERVKKDILLLAGAGVKTIKFVDRTFNCNRQRANEIIAFIIENHGKNIPHGVRFHFEVGADLFDPNTLFVLNSAPKGVFQIEAGLQSFHPQTLSAVNRKTDLKKLCQNLTCLIKGQKLHVHIDLIAGLPYEDFNTFASSFNLAFSLRPHMLQLGFLKLLYGAKIQEDKEHFGYEADQEPPYEIRKSRWLDEGELNLLRLAEDALDRLYNSGRFLQTVSYLLSASNLCPFSLFLGLGQFLDSQNKEKLSLDNFTYLAFDYFLTLTGVEKKLLRDHMATDRLRSNNTGRLPACLKVADPLLKQMTAAAKNKFGAKTTALYLYSQDFVLIVCYDEPPDPVTGLYTARRFRKDELV